MAAAVRHNKSKGAALRFKGLDLNLLYALDVLLDECSTLRAAERLHLSQPAVSASLRRLRGFFGDPLLLLHGNRLMPTALAFELRPAIKDVLAQVDGRILGQLDFDPTTSEREFRITASDYLVAVLFPQLLPALKREAPGIRLDITTPSEGTYAKLERGEVDFLLAPREHCHPDHPCMRLMEERHVVVGWKDNPLLAGALSEEAFVDAGHIAVSLGDVERTSFSERHLRLRSLARRIEVRCASFSMVGDLLVGTDRLAVMHERLAIRLSQRLPLAHVDMPFDFPVMEEMIQFHTTRGSDRSILWLRDRILAAACAFDDQVFSLADN
jgi:DNA-binding transcriptional LysR family regulator